MLSDVRTTSAELDDLIASLEVNEESPFYHRAIQIVELQKDKQHDEIQQALKNHNKSSSSNNRPKTEKASTNGGKSSSTHSSNGTSSASAGAGLCFKFHTNAGCNNSRCRWAHSKNLSTKQVQHVREAIDTSNRKWPDKPALVFKEDTP